MTTAPLFGGSKRWDLPPPVGNHSLPSHLAIAAVKVLMRRGIDTAEKLRVFLDPPHRLPYDPLRLSGMDRALQRLYRAINLQERVWVFGDFDVDGLTGTAIVAEGLEAFGLEVLPYLPHRSDEGHGLSTAAIDYLAGQGADLIITVDCGVTSPVEVAHAKQMGVDVIITDHHIPQADLPDAAAIIDPMMPGGSYPFPHLCGAGLAFKLIQGLYQYYGQPWDNGLLELAALGTIADLVPMVDENRYLVQEGLVSLTGTPRPGLQALYRLAGVQEQAFTTETVSFYVSPRLNASGRMGHAMDSYRLLTTKSIAEAESLAQKIEAMNRQRRELTEQVMERARRQVSAEMASKGLPALLMTSVDGITRGVAGLVAGRLAETFRRPAVAMTVEDDVVVGSGRSIPEFDIFQAFSDCQDIFVRFGGHAQAAGFTIAADKVPQLQERLTRAAEKSLDLGDLRPRLELDAEVELADLSGEFPSWVFTLEPFGPENPQPVFLTRRAQVLETRLMGNSGQHLKMRVTQGGQHWTALAFNQADQWVAGTRMVDLAYTLNRDRWQGAERINLKVADFRVAGDD